MTVERPCIVDVVDIQKRLNIKCHLVYLDRVGFVIAHTNKERKNQTIEQCELHHWLEGREGMPVGISGYYVAHLHEPDAYSESYMTDEWDFEMVSI